MLLVSEKSSGVFEIPYSARGFLPKVEKSQQKRKIETEKGKYCRHKNSQELGLGRGIGDQPKAWTSVGNNTKIHAKVIDAQG